MTALASPLHRAELAALRDHWDACIDALCRHRNDCRGGCAMTRHGLTYCAEGRRLIVVEQAAWCQWNEARWGTDLSSAYLSATEVGR